MTEEAAVAREELSPIPYRSWLGLNIPWWWETAGWRHLVHNGEPTDPLEAIPSLAHFRQLVEQGDITGMQKSRQSQQEVRVEEKDLMAEAPEWEHSDKEIREDINLPIAPEEAEAVQERREATPAMARVEMEEKGFSPIFPVWPLGMVVVEPVDRGTEPVASVEWAVEETEEVTSQRLQGRMG